MPSWMPFAASGSCCVVVCGTAIGSLLAKRKGACGKGKTLSPTKILEAAHQSGLDGYAGFLSDEKRIVFPHEDKCGPAKHKLKTILINGDQEGADVKITSAKQRGIVTWPYEQFIDDDTAARWLETPFVWKKQERNALAHMWTININKEFHETYDVEEIRPEGFDTEAAENLKKVARELFGAEEANRVKPWYCTKKPSKRANRQQVYVGTTSQFQEFFAKPGVMDALAINSFSRSDNKVRTAAVQKGKKYLCGCILCPGKKTGQREFLLSDSPTELQVMYKRNGYTSFMCFKPMRNFEEHNQLMGVLDA